MGGKDNILGFIPADTRVRYGDKRIQVFSTGFTVNKGLLARLQIAFQHHSANGLIGLDLNAIGMAHLLNQDMIEDLCLLAVVLAGILVRAIHNDGLEQRGVPGQQITRLTDTDRVVVGPFAAPQDNMAISIAS